MNRSRNHFWARVIKRLRQSPKLGNFYRPKTKSKARLGRRKKNAHVLEVMVKSRKQAKREQSLRWRRGIKVAVCVLAVIFLVSTVQGMLARHFWNSPDLLVAGADVQTNGSLSHDEILRRAGLAESENVYSVDLRTARESLEALPNVKRASIERELPGRLVVKVEERLPLAWLSCDTPSLQPFTSNEHAGACLLDEEGYLFRCAELRPHLMKLPVIHVRRLANVQSGIRVATDSVQVALNLVQRIRTHFGPMGLDVVEIDAPNDWVLVAKLTDDSVISFGYDDLDGQFARLTHIVSVSAERKWGLASVNLLPKSNVPVTFKGGQIPTDFKEVIAPASTVAVTPSDTNPSASSSVQSQVRPQKPTIQASQLDEILGGGL